MKIALKEAEKARSMGEIPVGAILVKDGIVISKAFNKRESRPDPTAHAELEAIRKAAKKLGTWRLSDCDIYVTLEPCAMCAGGIISARIRRLIFGAFDPKGGACKSVVDLVSEQLFNHKVLVEGGILQSECGDILTSFFRAKRKKS